MRVMMLEGAVEATLAGDTIVFQRDGVVRVVEFRSAEAASAAFAAAAEWRQR